MKKESDGKNRFIRIIYEDKNKHLQDEIIQMDEEDYYEAVSYRENVERVVREIFDEGGFWLNATTIIPYHQVKSFGTVPTHQVKPEQKPAIIKGRNNRRKRRPQKSQKRKNENTSHSSDQSSQA